MSITLAYFRATVPAFADPQDYTDAEIIPLLAMSDTSMPIDRWGEFRDYGQAMFVAHFLSMDARNKRTAEAGGLPGAVGGGLVSSKGVGGASMSYDLGSATESDAGHWNTSSYGTIWYRFAMMVGMSGLQLGGPDINRGYTFGQAWPGVVY